MSFHVSLRGEGRNKSTMIFVFVYKHARHCDVNTLYSAQCLEPWTSTCTQRFWTSPTLGPAQMSDILPKKKHLIHFHLINVQREFSSFFQCRSRPGQLHTSLCWEAVMGLSQSPVPREMGRGGQSVTPCPPFPSPPAWAGSFFHECTSEVQGGKTGPHRCYRQTLNFSLFLVVRVERGTLIFLFWDELFTHGEFPSKA